MVSGEVGFTNVDFSRFTASGAGHDLHGLLVGWKRQYRESLIFCKLRGRTQDA